VILDGELCEKKGENKNNMVVSRPEIGVTLQLNWYCLAYQKIIIFGG